MECPGLNGLWLACPASIDGLTGAERDFFRFLGEPILVAVALATVVAVTLVVLVATDGMAVGPRSRALPHEADLAGALRHARSLRRRRTRPGDPAVRRLHAEGLVAFETLRRRPEASHPARPPRHLDHAA